MEERINPTSVYGFVAWLVSFVALICYVIWQFVSDSLLAKMGITYLPLKYWGIALFLIFPAVSPLYPLMVLGATLRNNRPMEDPCYIGVGEGNRWVDLSAPQDSDMAWTGDLNPRIVRRVIKKKVSKDYLEPLQA